MDAPASDLRQLRDRIAAVVDLPEEEWAWAAPHFRPRHFGRGDHLARHGERMTHSHHIVHGLVRLYYTTPDGAEHNKGFAAEGRVVGSAASKLAGAPAGFDIQALEDTRTLSLPFEVADALVARHPAWERLRRLAMERLFLEKEQREKDFLTLDATARYLAFVEREPHLAGRVPLHHVASYLGITPVALSRIRRRLRAAA